MVDKTDSFNQISFEFSAARQRETLTKVIRELVVQNL